MCSIFYLIASPNPNFFVHLYFCNYKKCKVAFFIAKFFRCYEAKLFVKNLFNLILIWFHFMPMIKNLFDNRFYGVQENTKFRGWFYLYLITLIFLKKVFYAIVVSLKRMRQLFLFYMVDLSQRKPTMCVTVFWKLSWELMVQYHQDYYLRPL